MWFTGNNLYLLARIFKIVFRARVVSGYYNLRCVYSVLLFHPRALINVAVSVRTFIIILVNIKQVC